MNDSTERARLRWMCRRGMKELDVLLESFLQSRYDSLEDVHKAAFLRLLELEDPDFNAILMGKQEAPDSECADVVAQLRTQLSA